MDKPQTEHSAQTMDSGRVPFFRGIQFKYAVTYLLLIALVFLFCAVSCPTLGHVFHLGPFRIAAEQRQVFYRLYAAVTAGLFLLSFFIRER